MYRLDIVLYTKHVSTHSHLHMFDVFANTDWSGITYLYRTDEQQEAACCLIAFMWRFI